MYNVESSYRYWQNIGWKDSVCCFHVEKTEGEERSFWKRVDSTEYVDYSKTENWHFPDLKLTTKPITLRLPETLVDRVKVRAHRMDLPYQTFIKQLIYQGMSK